MAERERERGGAGSRSIRVGSNDLSVSLKGEMWGGVEFYPPQIFACADNIDLEQPTLAW